MPDRSKVMTQTKRAYPGPPGWGFGVGLTTAPCKTWICIETLTPSEEEEGWGGHGPKTGRTAGEGRGEEENVSSTRLHGATSQNTLMVILVDVEPEISSNLSSAYTKRHIAAGYRGAATNA
jgi:hypothetical protein